MQKDLVKGGAENRTDRSIAIALDREHLFEVETKKPKKKKTMKKSAGLF